jgi:hypothetical protein
MKQKTNNLKEDDLRGIGMENGTTVPTQSNSSTSNASNKNTASNVNIKKKDLSDPNIQRNLASMKGVNINVLDETENIDDQPKKIAYLSNIKDEKGNISKPFKANGFNYQMVRGITPEKEIVQAVYCLDEVDGAGDNLIHSVDHFEKNILKQQKPEKKEFSPEKKQFPEEKKTDLSQKKTQFPEEKKYPVDEDKTKKNPWAICTASVGREDKDKYEKCVMDVKKEYGIDENEQEPQSIPDNKEFLNHLNLKNLAGYKLFFVNKKTGEIKAQFKNILDLITSGTKLGKDEEYMDIPKLKQFRVKDLFKSDDLTEDDNATDQKIDGVDVPKLKSDTEKLVSLIKNKFSAYLAKLDKPVEQATFLGMMAKSIGVPINNLNSIMSTYGGLTTTETTIKENKIITKNQLIQSFTKNK